MNNLTKFGLSGVLSAIFFVFATVVFFIPEARVGLREFFSPPERKILSVASGRIFPDNSGRVVKLFTPKGLVLEIFSLGENQNEQLIDRIELTDKRDAHIQFQGRATNLALKDMDNDQVFEIIAPSYDSSLIPKLNIFRFNKSSNRFEPYIE
ncbi:MAG: hypothetical protein KDD38_04585 [Bdellovibrionales bacterium]|nr:hypothetical protein [Bdellovibrionales bacterium]